MQAATLCVQAWMAARWNEQRAAKAAEAREGENRGAQVARWAEERQGQGGKSQEPQSRGDDSHCIVESRSQSQEAQSSAHRPQSMSQ